MTQSNLDTSWYHFDVELGQLFQTISASSLDYLLGYWQKFDKTLEGKSNKQSKIFCKISNESSIRTQN